MAQRCKAEELTPGEIYRVLHSRSSDILRRVKSVRVNGQPAHGFAYVTIGHCPLDGPVTGHTGTMSLVRGTEVEVVESIDHGADELAEILADSEDGDIVRVWNIGGRFYA